jgi:hypothetical protein
MYGLVLAASMHNTPGVELGKLKKGKKEESLDDQLIKIEKNRKLDANQITDQIY